MYKIIGLLTSALGASLLLGASPGDAPPQVHSAITASSAQVSPQDVSSFLVQARDADEAARLVTTHGGRVTARLDIINGVGALLDAKQHARIATQPQVRVTEDRTTKVTSTYSDQNVVVPEAYADSYFEAFAELLASHQANSPNQHHATTLHNYGYRGNGVGVAIVDTGVWEAREHDFWGRLAAQVDTTGPEIYEKRLNEWKPGVDDGNGHGTHLASIIASGIWAGYGTEGVAPNAHIVALKAFDETGAGRYQDVIDRKSVV